MNVWLKKTGARKRFSDWQDGGSRRGGVHRGGMSQHTTRALRIALLVMAIGARIRDHHTDHKFACLNLGIAHPCDPVYYQLRICGQHRDAAPGETIPLSSNE